MAHYNTILQQLLHLIPRHHFEKRVHELGSDRYAKKLTTWGQFTVLLYAQAGGKTSLRDIQNSLACQANHLYHLGLPDSIPRSTLADANAKRDYRVFEDLFYRLQERCHALAPKHRFPFKNPLFSIDSTVIELSVTLFPWTRYARMHGALKLHYGYDHSGDFPTFLAMTPRKHPDNKLARELFPIVPDSINCFDRGYLDFSWFRQIHDGGAFFVTRSKSNQCLHIVEERPLPQEMTIQFDRVVEFAAKSSFQSFPHPMRLIGYIDPASGRLFQFLTNNMQFSAKTIAQVYKARWQIEAFFKWIKQNLKIKTYLGTSKNAVLTQIWTAMCYYLLLAYIKFQTRYAHSLFYLHRILKTTLLDRFSLIDLLSLRERSLRRLGEPDPQLCLSF